MRISDWSSDVCSSDLAGPHEIFDEHARLSAFENRGERVFNLAGLVDLGLDAYHALTPIRWPVQAPGIGSERLFGDGRFPTPAGRERFVPTTPLAPAHAPSVQYTFVFNTGRIREQLNTMKRTGQARTTAAHTQEPNDEPD